MRATMQLERTLVDLPVLRYKEAPAVPARRGRTTSVDYARPHRPWPIAVANQVGRVLGSFARSSLRVDSLISEARRRTGLERFGDETFRSALEALVDSIEREAMLHPVGRAMVRRALVGALSNRLRAEALFERRPEILQQPI